MIGLSIVRGLQLLFSVIVLALSITAVKWQVYGSAPASSGYNSFAGAWATLFSLIGFVAVFVSSVPGLIVAALDGLTFLILLAGGIAYAVQLRGITCSNPSAILDNADRYTLVNGGSTPFVDSNGNSFTLYGVPSLSDGSPNLDAVKSRCNTVVADDVFIFFAAITALAAAALVFVAHRRGGTRHSAV
ncbi:hypothetical protein AMS68_007394 [Peltaster fructicola]|uniref:MARVEL domain-containing protein n=1 Tax=Peltaster fructicola TaxID=286661 RepID=A0A6H0Y4C2_9PEZI|nr:hypothetical protein AMS68_007394 [Peltaster fructicola]